MDLSLTCKANRNFSIHIAYTKTHSKVQNVFQKRPFCVPYVLNSNKSEQKTLLYVRTICL